jgi:lipoprotein-releasing system ATP-binding protein
LKTILQATNLTKNFSLKGGRTVRVLNSVSLSVAEKEIVAIVGASGSGKTTLLNILGTIDTADDGDLVIDGQKIFDGKKYFPTPNALAALRNTHIGFVFQFHHLLEDFTALENAAMPSYITSGNLKAAKAKAEALLVELGLGDRLHQLPSELSGGEAQRVAIARALVNDAKLILADEPSGNLDTKNSQMLYDLIFELCRKKEKSFVIVTHNAAYAASADRTLQMKDGNLL